MQLAHQFFSASVSWKARAAGEKCITLTIKCFTNFDLNSSKPLMAPKSFYSYNQSAFFFILRICCLNHHYSPEVTKFITPICYFAFCMKSHRPSNMNTLTFLPFFSCLQQAHLLYFASEVISVHAIPSSN